MKNSWKVTELLDDASVPPRPVGDYRMPPLDPPQPSDIPNSAEEARQRREGSILIAATLFLIAACVTLSWIFGGR